MQEKLPTNFPLAPWGAPGLLLQGKGGASALTSSGPWPDARVWQGVGRGGPGSADFPPGLGQGPAGGHTARLAGAAPPGTAAGDGRGESWPWVRADLSFAS